jgi:hypothetical protein
METLAARLNRPPRKALQFNLEISMDSDFARLVRTRRSHMPRLGDCPAALRAERAQAVLRTLPNHGCGAPSHECDEGRQSNGGHVSRAAIMFMSIWPRALGRCWHRSASRPTLQNGFAGVQPDAGGISAGAVDALHRAPRRVETQGHELDDECHIVNFSRFAQYYRAQIGVSPSTTLREKTQ